MSSKKLIVGIDPGTTAAVAIISLSGKVISIESKRNFKRDEMIKHIVSHGIPTIIATDRSNVPSLVEKVSTAFNSVIYHPKQDLSQKEKVEITRNFYVEDSHQRDALAAAIHAFFNYRELMEKIDRKMDEMGLWRYRDDVKDLILRGEANNIVDAIEKIFRPKNEKETEVEKEKSRPRHRSDEKIRERLLKRDREIEILKNYSKKLEMKIDTLEKSRSTKIEKKIILRDKKLLTEIDRKKKLIENMRRDIKDLKRLNDIRKKGLVPVFVARDTTCESLRKLNELFSLKGEIVYFRQYVPIPTNFLKELKKRDIEIIIGDFPIEVKEKLENNITIISKKDVGIKIQGRIGEMDLEELNKIKKGAFVKWVKNYKKRMKK